MRSTQPQNNEPIYSIQHYLRRISYYDDRIPFIIPDGIYGEQTENTVREFQKYYNLEQTGIVDNDTWDSIIRLYTDISTPVYLPSIACFTQYRNNITKIDQEIDCLFLIQSMMYILSLRFENFDNVDISGVHKNDSQEFTKKIQRIADLPDTGEIDLKTYNAIARLYEIYI